MGYENRIYVVNKYKSKGFEESVKDYFSCDEIATFDLSGIDYDLRKKIEAYPDTDCYIWVNDEPVTTDCYGKPIKEIPIKDAVKLLNYASATSDYRRYEPCASLLRGFNTSEWEDLVVLSYGY